MNYSLQKHYELIINETLAREFPGEAIFYVLTPTATPPDETGGNASFAWTLLVKIPGLQTGVDICSIGALAGMLLDEALLPAGVQEAVGQLLVERRRQLMESMPEQTIALMAAEA